MKKYLVLIDNQETFVTNDKREAHKIYNYYYDRHIPVAMYKVVQFSY